MLSKIIKRIEYLENRIEHYEKLEKTKENEQIKSSLRKIININQNKLLEEVGQVYRNLGGN